MDAQEIGKLITQNTVAAEELVRIYLAYFEFIEFGDSPRAAALYEAIEKSMDQDMKFILDLARKRRANPAPVCFSSEG